METQLNIQHIDKCRLRSPCHLGKVYPGREPVNHPTMQDIAWAAGIWEGEGYVNASESRYTRKDGITVVSVGLGVTVSQKDRELCDRMRDLFGGSVNSNIHPKTLDTYHKWFISSTRAAGFIMTIFKFLTTRRKIQVKKALRGWKHQ